MNVGLSACLEMKRWRITANLDAHSTSRELLLGYAFEGAFR